MSVLSQETVALSGSWRLEDASTNMKHHSIGSKDVAPATFVPDFDFVDSKNVSVWAI